MQDSSQRTNRDPTVSNSPTDITFSGEYTVIKPANIPHYPISCNDWRYVKTSVRNISGMPNYYDLFGGSALGVALSTLMAVLLNQVAITHRGTAWSICVASAVIGFALLIMGHEMHKSVTVSKAEIVQFMEHIEQRFPKISYDPGT